jgi:isopenicillin N synthase-like dioxygenase
MDRGGTAWRGWFPLGGELTSGQPDQKEGIYFGTELPPSALPLHGPNLFPPELPELRGTVLDWMEQMEQLGQRLLGGLASSLELPRDHFARALTRRPLCLFRIFHYPAPRDAQTWGVGEHTDYGLLTLLKQDDCGGLQVKTARGWVEAEPIAGTFVCNLGDMLDRMTGGRYRSTPHRVRNTSGRSRYSWPFFLDPSFDADVKPLPGALERPPEVDAAERWDRASPHTLSGTYGEYLVGKVSRVFPLLAKSLKVGP